MFFLFALTACIMAIVNAHFLEFIDTYTIFQIVIFLLAGMAAFYTGKMKDRAVLDVMFIWSGWVLATDWGPYFPPILSAIETVLFISVITCVYFRTYKHLSHPFDMNTVFIAFYGGPSAPFLSRLSAHIGFPFSSIAIVAGDIGIRPSKAAGEMVEVPLHILQSKGYVFINTKVPVTPEILEAMESIIGTKTGYGVFRYKCLKNILPVLECLGTDWVPKNIGVFPSRFYAQCVRASNG